MNFAGNHALRFNLNTSLREDHTVEPPRNYHPVAFNLSFDLRAFAQNHGLLRDDVPFYVAVNSERTCDRECSVEGHALIDETSPFFVVSAVLCYAGPFPRHDDPQKRLFHSSGLRRQVNEAL